MARLLNNIRVVVNPISVRLNGRIFPSTTDLQTAQLVLDPGQLTREDLEEAQTLSRIDELAHHFMLPIRMGAPKEILTSELPGLGDEEAEALIVAIQGGDPKAQQNLQQEIESHRELLDFAWLEENISVEKGRLQKDLSEEAKAVWARNGDSDFSSPEEIERRSALPRAFDAVARSYAGQDGAREQDEKKLRQMVEKLPVNMRSALSLVPTTYVISDLYRVARGSSGSALGPQDMVVLDRSVIRDHDIFAFQEEVLHLLDYRIGFTSRPEWQEAARTQIDHFSSGMLNHLDQALRSGLKSKTNPYRDGSHGYSHEEKQFVELLVDYFHLKRYEEKQFIEERRTTPSKEKMNERMQELLPHIFPRCRQFEKELLVLAQEGTRATQAGR